METIRFTIALIVIYIYIYKTKEVQNLFVRNQKALLKDIKDLNERKGIL